MQCYIDDEPQIIASTSATYPLLFPFTLCSENVMSL
jgi:hypothetical protein